jgi:hypothetical protein
MLLLYRCTYTRTRRVCIMPTSGHHLNSVFGLIYVILDVLYAVVVIVDLASTVCFGGLLEVRSLWALGHIALVWRFLNVTHMRARTRKLEDEIQKGKI